MIIVRNNLMPFGKKYAAINLFGVFFVKRHVRVSPELINHEMIHTRQMQELLYVPFYIAYVVEWVFRLFRNGFKGHSAYLSVSFEREAYAHGDDPDYLRRRRCYGQWRRH